MASSSGSLLEQALSFHQQGQFAQAIACYQQILQLTPASFDALHLLGVACFQTGQAQAAVEHISRAIAVDPSQPAAHSNLGNALQSLQRSQEALASYERALVLAPDFVDALYNRGNILQQFQRDHEALASYERALQLKPDFAGAWYNRGVLLQRLQQLEPALLSYERALNIVPGYVFALNNKGVVLQSLQRYQQALASYDQALHLKPDYAEAWNNRGNVLREMQQFEPALQSYQQALNLQPGYVEAWFNCGNVLHDLKRDEEALNSYGQALMLQPAYFDAWLARGDLLRDRGDKQEALQCFESALSLRPSSMLAHFKHLMALIPVLPMDADEPEHSRRQFAEELSNLQGKVPQLDVDIAAVGTVLPFYLAYHEHNNRELLAQYGRICCQIMAAWQEQQGLLLRPQQHGSRIRIGIISAHIQNQSVWHAIVKGWFEKLDKTQFELHVIFPETLTDHETAYAQTLAASFEYGIKPLGEWASIILDKQLDIIIHPEFGMNPTTAQLACMRLAPVQMATWGHPETTGLPTMDYYLSAEAFEDSDAQQNYAEKLICLPHLGCYYEPLETVEKETDFEQWGIQFSNPVMLCPGTPFKYQPQHDEIFVEIARRLGNVQLVFFNYHRIPQLSQKLAQRIAGKFAAAGLDFNRHVVSIPWQKASGFYHLMHRATLMLDTIGFSGFNTAMQAISCDLPIAAYQGRFMRGKLASALLHRLDLQACVADNIPDYLDCVTRLATDHAFVSQVRLRMQTHKHRLYQDDSLIQALETVLAGLADKHN